MAPIFLCLPYVSCSSYVWSCILLFAVRGHQSSDTNRTPNTSESPQSKPNIKIDWICRGVSDVFKWPNWLKPEFSCEWYFDNTIDFNVLEADFDRNIFEKALFNPAIQTHPNHRVKPSRVPYFSHPSMTIFRFESGSVGVRVRPEMQTLYSHQYFCVLITSKRSKYSAQSITDKTHFRVIKKRSKWN